MTLTIDSTITLNNGVEMPLLGLGVLQSAAGSETECAVRYALEANYRHIDTAAIYGNEREVGKSVNAGIVSRDDIFVTSKVWTTNLSYEGAKHAFNASMEKLGFDYLDLYLIHWPTNDWRGAWRALEELYEEGRVRAIGVSNFLPHHLNELLQICSIRPAVNQYEMHPYLQQPELRKLCQDNGIAVTAWSPIMKGRVLAVPELVAIGEKHGKSAVQVTLRWLLQLGVIAIPKSVNKDRIEANADLYDFELSEDDMATINALDQGERIGPHPDTFRG
ncbi:MAG: aldo/keto reductase [Chloroflexi bacterium]|nr:aldo/keto reductase [Chloroflexota bacterium]